MSKTRVRLGVGLLAALLGLAAIIAIGAAAPVSSPTEAPLSPDDVSWLFPAPTKAADLTNLISINDLTVPDPANSGHRLPVWSDEAFGQFLQIADSDAAQVGGPGGPRIGIPQWARSKIVWFIAGVRIDAGAPGLSPAIVSVFGQRPQIRLILQPVQPDGSAHPQDITAHLVFDFVVDQNPPANCPFFAVPDIASFKTVVLDAANLRDQLDSGAFAGAKVSTSGLPLGLHPGLANSATAPLVRTAMKALLERHISDARLRTMALMGTPANQPSPWIFLSMLRVGQVFVPVHGPTLDGVQFAMMFSGGPPGASPTPHTNNLAPISCASAAFPPVPPFESRHGSATADTFSGSPDVATISQTLDLIADPARSHFFNTDCVSCHTETERARELLQLANSPGLSPDVMPSGPYTVRNFGWSPEIDGPVHGVATRRTVAETTAVVAWINANLLNK